MTQFTWTYDNTSPSVTIAGPNGVATAAFDVTVTFSESVTGLAANEITVTNGSVTSLSGSGTTYTATINPVLQTSVTVSIAAGVAEDLGGNGNTASNIYTRQAASPASEFEAKKAEIERVISEEVMRSVTATISGNTKLMSAVMGRFVRNGSGMKSDYGFLSGGEIPLDFNYSFSANDDGALASGDFVKEFIGGKIKMIRLYLVILRFRVMMTDPQPINLAVNLRGKSQ